MAFWTYMLRCADGRYYTGHTDQLETRIAQHGTGGFCDFTSRRCPVELVWSQEFPSRIEALEAERQVGGWSRKKKEALIGGDWKALSYFARSPRARSSTSLGTNGVGSHREPFMSSEVETRGDLDAGGPFVSSEVETPIP